MGLNALVSPLRRWRKPTAARGGGPGGSAPGAEDGWRTVIRLGCLGLVWLVAVGSLFFPARPETHGYAVGQIADRTLLTDVPFEYEDRGQTRLAREAAAHRVPPVFAVRPAAITSTLGRLEQLRQEVASGGGELQPALANWSTLAGAVESICRRGLADPEAIRSRFAGRLAGYEVLYIRDDRQDNVRFPLKLGELTTPEQAADLLAREFVSHTQPYPTGFREALRARLALLLEPNLELDAEATRAAQEYAASQVPVIRTRVPAGVPLLRRGERIGENDLVRLTHYHQLQRAHGQEWSERLARLPIPATLLLLAFLAAAYLLDAIHRDAIRATSGVILITTILLLQILLNRMVGNFLLATFGGARNWLSAALPLSFGAMLLCNLVGLRTAAWTGLLGTLVATFQFPEQPPLLLLLAGGLGGVTAAILMRKAHRRYQIIWAGFGIALALAVTTGLLLLLQGLPPSGLRPLPAASLCAGLGYALLAAFTMPLFEYCFGITTDLYLLEMSDLNHPLLKRLQMEAPGTYHHSLLVATLAEEAAAAIGANPLLARVCAYFHDIGKLANPDYFTENSTGENPHDDLKPHLSSLVILNHVKTGLELAARHKLKKPIREAIAQHHGTSLVAYFYHRALKDQQQSLNLDLAAVGEQEFRYPGPLPMRREVVIISLADAMEAATRALAKPTPQKIRAQAEEILQRRIEDGQLNHADLTFRELTIVKETILRTLTTMHHGRIQYPKGEENDPDAEPQREPPPVEPPLAAPQP